MGFVDVVLAENVSIAYRQRTHDWSDAQSQVQSWLLRLFGSILDGVDGSRLDPGYSRIKAENRTLDKLRRKCEEDPAIAVMSPADVELHIQDIVGVKVLCKSPRDQQAAYEALTTTDLTDTPFEVIASKDYVSDPKPSGYRGFHVILQARLTGADPVCVEVQIKTRLQDAWSELTHEDLYKPGAPISPSLFHKSVAAHMASLLAVVDDMADELASALEATITEDVRASDEAAETREHVRVRTTGPRYALAVDTTGRQGLIQAVTVRDLAHAAGLVAADAYIDVSKYLHTGDELEIEIVETDEARYYVPIALPSRTSMP